MATIRKLGLTRDQLASFLDDFEKIKQFEGLFTFTDSTTETLDTLREDIDSLSEDVVGLQCLPPPREPLRSRLGSFYDTTTQTAAAINTAYAITFNTTDLSRGVYIGSPTSRIYVNEPAVYNIQFSAQVDNTSGGDHLAHIWLRLNGVNVSNSAGQVRVKGTTGELVAAWNYFIDLKSNDYIELMWSVSDTAVQLTASGAVAPVPAIPSVILTVFNNIEG